MSSTKKHSQSPCPATVTFPCDLPQWSEVKKILQDLKCCPENSASVAGTLQLAYKLVHKDEKDVKKKVFSGLQTFLDNSCTCEEQRIFYRLVLPCIIERALEVESLLPLGGLSICKEQKECCVEISRTLVASIVACGFLGLFPDRPCEKQHPLNAINFDNFFQHLSNTGQCGKLRCVLHYFERIAQDPGGPVGNIIFIRQVQPTDKLPCKDDWLSCDTPLCNMEVHSSGFIEDAGSKTLQVDFANKKIGGGVLTAGKVQEEIRFSVCPELLASMLLMETMADNEAILIQGFETFSNYQGYSRTFHYAGDYRDQAKRNSFGNLENSLCAIDALPASRIGGIKNQYKDIHMLRELNKAFTGFQQEALQPVAAPGGEVVDPVNRAISEEYHSAEESTDPVAVAGAEGGSFSPSDASVHTSLTNLTDSSPSSGRSSMSFTDAPSQFRQRKPPRDLPSPGSRLPRQHSQGSSSSERGDSPRQFRSMPPKQLSQTLPAVTLPWQSSLTRSCDDDLDGSDRRRSSAMSDLVSRRSSSDSSRRSSSKRSSSEFSSEFEEYYESFQKQERKLKPIAIQEEGSVTSLQELAAGLVTEAVEEGSTESRHRQVILPLYTFKGSPHKPVAIKPERSPLWESSKESSVDSAGETLKPEHLSDTTQEEEEEYVCEGAEALPLPLSMPPKGKPALPDPMDLTDILTPTSHVQESPPILKETPSSRSLTRRQRGLHRQAGIVHFVDNLVNQASEESRQQLQSQNNNTEEQRLLERSQGSLELDLDVEVAPMAPLEVAISSKGGARVKTHRIELKEESPSSSWPPKVPYSDTGEFFNTNLPELNTTLIKEEDPSELSNGEGAEVKNPEFLLPSSATRDECQKQDSSQSDQERSLSQDGDDGSSMGPVWGMQGTIQEGQDTGEVPVQAYIAISELSDDLVAHAMDEAFGVLGIVSGGSTVDQESGERCRQQQRAQRHRVEYYAEGLLRSVFRGALKAAARELYKMKQTPSTMCSSEENLLLSYEMYAYVEDFVEGVMDEALDMYNRQYVPLGHNRKRKSVEEIWVKPLSESELDSDAKYFEAEFKLQTSTRSCVDCTDQSQALSQRLFLDAGVHRRSSYDELAHSKRRSSSSGFKNTVLSDFEDELVRSNVSSPSLKMLCFATEPTEPSKRRASEPAAACGFLDPSNKLQSMETKRKSCDSLDITSSREMILDWLEDCSQTSMVSVGHKQRRQRTTSSHLDWFAQDLLVDIFNDAFIDMFGDNYMAYRDCLGYTSQQRSVASLEADSVDGESSHCKAQEDLCIPSYLESYANNLSGTVLSAAVQECIKRKRRSLSGEASSNEYYDAPDVPWTQLDLIADSFAWRIIEEARVILRKEIEKGVTEVKPGPELRPIATGNWGCGAYRGDPQLKAMLQWAAASRAGTPCLLYYTFGLEELTQLEAVCKAFQQENYTIGQMLRLVFEYCRLRSAGETSKSLFEYFKESDA